MKRMAGKAWAAWIAAAGLSMGAVAEPEPVSPDWSDGLCDTVAEGVSLLEEIRLAPERDQAAAALLEGLIRAAEPSVEFLDEAQLQERSRRLAEKEWETGLTLVATEGLPKVAAVAKDSPAAAAGIQAGELIEKIDGHSVLSEDGLTVIRDWLTEGEEAGLEIGVRAADESSRLVTIERVRRADSSVADVEELPTGIGYVRVAGLDPGAGREIAEALERWQNSAVFGAILDLRGAGGTAEDEVAVLAARFVPEGAELYSKTDRNGQVLATVRAAAAPVESLPLMVLMDESTSGASELLAAVLGGSGKGSMLIGRETAGDPLIREPLKLSTGRYALLATRQITTPDGSVYAGSGGVSPDVIITDAALNETVYEPDMPILRRGKTLSEEEKADRALRDRTRNDTYLRRATDVLLGLQALGYGRK